MHGTAGAMNNIVRCFWNSSWILGAWKTCLSYHPESYCMFNFNVYDYTSQLILALLSEQVRRKKWKVDWFLGIVPPNLYPPTIDFQTGVRSLRERIHALYLAYCGVWFGLFVFAVFILCWTVYLCTTRFYTVCLCTVCFCTVYFCPVCLCCVCFVFLLFVFFFTVCFCTVSYINCYESKNLQSEVVGTR